MKTKVTLTIERTLVPQAKDAAARRGASLSALVEDFLRGMIEDQTPPFGDRWRGAFQLAEGDDPRLDALKRKYH